ncbi:MAG: hypothetical protein IPG02_10160 [Ignavibacteria bacterium]|nr:hypothetical protein [Ignavibacteria bacterium]
MYKGSYYETHLTFPRSQVSFGPVLFLQHFHADCAAWTVHSQWIPQSIPVSKPITGLEFIDSLNGWAVTGLGPEQDTCYILNTSNEGNNWFVQQKFYNYTFYSMDMVDSMVGYASGVGGVEDLLCYKTTNGGFKLDRHEYAYAWSRI